MMTPDIKALCERNRALLGAIKFGGESPTSQRALESMCEELLAALETPKGEPAPGWQNIPVTDETIMYVLRYGGRCRECADNFGICEGSGLPCQRDEARKAARHVIEAINYGFGNGFMPLPAAEVAK